MQTELNADRLLTRAEVQTYFGLSQRYLEISATRGDGPPFFKIGRSVRYRVAELRSWIETQEVNQNQLARE